MPAKLKPPRDGAGFDAPIEHLFPTNPEAAKMLRGLGIHTVEMCSRLTPYAVERLGGAAQGWVNRAKRYLQSAKSNNCQHVPLWRVIESMSDEHRRELRELIDDECQAAWNAAVEQIAQGLELEIDHRPARANRIRQLKDIVPISSPQRTRRTK